MITDIWNTLLCSGEHSATYLKMTRMNWMRQYPSSTCRVCIRTYIYKHALDWIGLSCIVLVYLHNALMPQYVCTLLNSVICHMPGTLLHFDDHGLKDLYFLDPQWLAKLMAHVIHPYAVEGDTPVVKGKHFSKSSFPLLLLVVPPSYM